MWPKAKKKQRKEKEAEGLRKKNEIKAQSANVCQRHKSEKKNDEKHKVLEKRVICSMLDWIDFIVLHAYVVITCSCHWSLTTFHHSSFIISLPFNPLSPLDSVVPCIIMGGEFRATTSLWRG